MEKRLQQLSNIYDIFLFHIFSSRLSDEMQSCLLFSFNTEELSVHALITNLYLYACKLR